MSIKFKFNILDTLKQSGYNTNRIRKEKLLSESTLQYLRTDKMISIDAIDRLCKLLGCQPGDILEYVPEDSDVKPQVSESSPESASQVPD